MLARHVKGDMAHTVNGPTDRRRLSALGVLILTGLLTGCGLNAATEQAAATDVTDAPAASAAADASCKATQAASSVGGNDWRRRPSAEHAIEAVGDALSERFGTASKAAPQQQLANGLLGVVADDGQEMLRIVVDPAVVDTEALSAALNESANGEVAVRVEEGCHSSKELIEAHEAIGAQDWSPEGKAVPYSVELDSLAGRWQVDFAPSDRAAAAALKKRLGNLVVTTTDGGPQRNGTRH